MQLEGLLVELEPAEVGVGMAYDGNFDTIIIEQIRTLVLAFKGVGSKFETSVTDLKSTTCIADRCIRGLGCKRVCQT